MQMNVSWPGFQASQSSTLLLAHSSIDPLPLHHPSHHLLSHLASFTPPQHYLSAQPRNGVQRSWRASGKVRKRLPNDVKLVWLASTSISLPTSPPPPPTHIQSHSVNNHPSVSKHQLWYLHIRHIPIPLPLRPSNPSQLRIPCWKSSKLGPRTPLHPPRASNVQIAHHHLNILTYHQQHQRHRRYLPHHLSLHPSSPLPQTNPALHPLGLQNKNPCLPQRPTQPTTPSSVCSILILQNSLMSSGQVCSVVHSSFPPPQTHPLQVMPLSSCQASSPPLHLNLPTRSVNTTPLLLETATQAHILFTWTPHL